MVKSGILTEATNDSTRRGIIRDLRVALSNRKLMTDDGQSKRVRLLAM